MAGAIVPASLPRRLAPYHRGSHPHYMEKEAAAGLIEDKLRDALEPGLIIESDASIIHTL